MSRGMFLGRVWLILAPILDVLLYGFVFGVLLKTSRGIEYFVLFLFIGVTFFQFMAGSINGASGFIKKRKNAVKAFPFPRVCLVLSLLVQRCLDSLPSIGVLIIAVLIFPDGPGISYHWLVAPLVWFLMVFLTGGLMLVTSWLTEIIPDMKTLVKYVVRFWFYSSGVFYSIDRFSGGGWVHMLLELNPGSIILSAFRDSLIYQSWPDGERLVLLAVYSFSIFFLGLYLFWSREPLYAKD
ncbi:ABC transporter permease [Corynebacterium sp. CCM 9185]|uniref:Transport permease protein n=1 Tax=Corynebacterium marambiense TaxID=2765364 RepID=A0ABS0VWQ9_9CORY|nr:ABC transporter permease [Corynebacterium marambiense]MBI9001192.1 ABC transporter permease [Corynebacterium marambiense]MCK7663751.1 ABC transporter permease [Corynebacterium marambiense]